MKHKSTLCYAALAKKRILNKVSMYIPSDTWLRFNELSTAIFHLKIKGGGGMKLTLANRKTREKTKHKSASMGEENSTWLEKNNTSQSSTFQVTPHSQEKGSESADLATEGEHEPFSAWQQVRTKRVTDMEITSASTAEKEEANRCHLPLKGPVRQSAIFCSEGHFFFFSSPICFLLAVSIFRCLEHLTSEKVELRKLPIQSRKAPDVIFEVKHFKQAKINDTDLRVYFTPQSQLQVI